jgi:cysteine dioxygenase
MTPTLATLVGALDAYEKPIRLHEAEQRLTTPLLGPEEVQDFVHFDPERYQRYLIAAREHYQLLLLCWDCGQESPIHNHRGSNCAFVVVQGQATEVFYRVLPDGTPLPLGFRVLSPGQLSLSYDADVHKVATLPDQRLITLHLYSPPLRNMEVFTPGKEL